MFRKMLIPSLLILAACSEGEPEFRTSSVRRAVEIVAVGEQPGADCTALGPIAMPEQDLSSLGGATGGAEVDFFHDLTRKALRMEANLVIPTGEVEAADAAASGEVFNAQAYRCPR
ncbi:MAG: hypothetical protein P8Q97_05620 [Myxococcota bacterium]|nr:hypothetical protein [Myxococcota bacterium]